MVNYNLLTACSPPHCMLPSLLHMQQVGEVSELAVEAMGGCGLCLAPLLRPSIVYGTRRLAMGLELVMYICRLLACKVLFQLLSLASHLVSEQDTLCSTGCIFLITNMHKRLHVVCLFLHPRSPQFKEAWFRSLWEPEQAHQLVECTCWCQMRHPVQL